MVLLWLLKFTIQATPFDFLHITYTSLKYRVVLKYFFFISDLRAKLEMSIARVRDLAEKSKYQKDQEGEYSSDSESQTVSCNVQLTTAVRKYLASCIRDLMQHGTHSPSSTSLVPLMGCFPRRNYLDTQVSIRKMYKNCLKNLLIYQN